MLTNLQFKSFRQEAENALQEIAKKYDVNIKTGSIKYTSNSFNVDLQVTKKEVNGIAFEQAEFERYCFLYGIPKNAYNKELNMNGKKYYPISFKPKASKYPVIVKCSDGNNYKWEITTLVEAIRRATENIK